MQLLNVSVDHTKELQKTGSTDGRLSVVKDVAPNQLSRMGHQSMKVKEHNMNFRGRVKKQIVLNTNA
jgi:hypothetical protein